MPIGSNRKSGHGPREPVRQSSGHGLGEHIGQSTGLGEHIGQSTVILACALRTAVEPLPQRVTQLRQSKRMASAL
jgi:hypothetical protein